MYRKIDREILARLQDIAGDENLLRTGEEMEDYSHDENFNLRFPPEAVVKPASAAEISAILKLANRYRFPVVPRGGGTGLTGGALASLGGLVMSLERMNRVLDIDPENMMARTEAGVITGEFQKAVEERGLFYPPDPASLDSCSLGGNFAEDAGGPRAAKYGVTRDFMRGVEAVLPEGDTISYGGKIIKNVTGYNLLHTLIGAEGTLAVAAEITVSLLPLPARRVDLLVPFPSYRGAVRSVLSVLGRPAPPAAVEFMDRNCLRVTERVLGSRVGAVEADAHLLFQVDGWDDDEVRGDYERIGEICLDNGAEDVIVADSARNQEKLWEHRRKLRDCLREISPVISAQDVVVPRSRLVELLEGVERIGEESGLKIVSFGHAGDGNVHVNILREEAAEDEWRSRLAAATGAIFSLAVGLGGSISGEHGIGLTKKDYLTMALKPRAIEAMRRLKSAWDPNNILNPGKIFSV